MVDTQKRKPESETPENGLFPRGELLALLCGIVMLVSFLALPWFNTPLEVTFPEADADNPAYLIDIDGNVLDTQYTPALNEDGDVVIVNDRDRDFDFEGVAPFLLNDEGQAVTLAENGKFIAFRRLGTDITDANAYDEDNENPQPQLLNPNGEFVLFENNTVIVVPKVAGIGTAAVEDEGFVIYREVTALSRFTNPSFERPGFSAVELNTALLIPIMGIIGIGLALYSMVEPFHRRRSVIGMMIVGGIALLYYGMHFQISSDSCQVTVNGLGGGYWLSFFGAVGLILQGFIPRPRGQYSLTPRRGNMSVPAGQRLRPAMMIMYIILTLSAVAAVVPFLWMISTSFMTLGETLTGEFIPSQIQVCNYVEAWDEAQFGEYFVNSVIITATVIIGLLITSILSAYAFARIEFFGRNTIFTLLLITLMIPESVTMIPNFLIVSGNLFPLPQFGLETAALAGDAQTLNYIFGSGGTWLNTLTALTVPFMASAFSIFLLRQFFAQVPSELWDAVRIDGGGHLRFLIQIVLPVSRSAILTVTLLTFIGAWNAFLWPLIVTTEAEWRPLMVGLYNFTQEAGTELHLLMAGSFITILPMLILYFLTQKSFTEGIATSGLKG